MTPYQEVIYKSRYARWIEENARREDWNETVDRYVNFISAQCERLSSPLKDKEKKELTEAIYKQEIMPSMRALMTAGKAAERDNVSLYNCLSGETLVTTKEFGITPIKNLAGKFVHVVDGNSNWVLSECKHYGKQSTYSLALSSSGIGEDFIINSTENHRWVMNDGSIKTTSDLQPNDKLAFVSMPTKEKVDVNSDDYKSGVVHGLVYGDGTALHTKFSAGISPDVVKIKKICRGFVIRLCTDQDSLLPYFLGYPCSYPKSFNGEPVVYLFKDAAVDLKSLPDLSLGFYIRDYIVGFIRGWFAADGSISKSGQVSMSATKAGLDWLYSASAITYFIPRSIRKFPSETNYGKRSEDLYYVELDRRWLDAEDVIIDRKRERFRSIDFSKSPGFGKVKSVYKNSDSEDVYCFEVPTTNSFLLTKNILTGNCSFLPIDNIKSFDEVLYILANGTGVGFSVEQQYVSKLPEVPDTLIQSDTIIVVPDSKIGWATALRELISLLYAGKIPHWDVSKIRPAGARLKTMGGRASGSGPLVEVFEYTVSLFKRAIGRQLTTIECHDLVCKIAESIIVGGVRRAALISLSDLSDERMRSAKSGQWWLTNVERALANNSAVYTEKPTIAKFLDEWKSLYESQSGERGIFNREQIYKHNERFGRRENEGIHFGVNPCGEINLRPFQFCNLSNVILRPTDTIDDVERKVRLATIIGTIQSTFTDFRYLRSAWKKNCDEERLLGVGMSAIMDNPMMNAWQGYSEEIIKKYTLGKTKNLEETLSRLRELAVSVNKEWAKRLGIEESKAITCVKPDGNSSQFNGCSSGIHPAYSPFYLRTVRMAKTDPVSKVLIDSGVYFEDDVTNPNTGYVFTFPIKSSATVFRNDVSAIDQLELYKTYHDNYTEHNPSITIYVRENEWLDVAAWVYKNFDSIGGVSFLPHTDHIYKQAPYQEITEEEYNEWLVKTPQAIKWDLLSTYELDDQTTSAKELACVAGVCEL